MPVKGADVVDHPVAPPRTKHRRQTLQEFRKLNTSDKKKSFAKNGQSNVNELFQSEHRTDDGKDLLPVRKTIAFDCHYGFLFEENHEAVSKVNSAQDILVLIKGNLIKSFSEIKEFSRIKIYSKNYYSNIIKHHFFRTRRKKMPYRYKVKRTRARVYM